MQLWHSIPDLQGCGIADPGVRLTVSDTARGEFQSAIRLQSNYAEAHYRLGLVYQGQGKNADAEREFRVAQQTSGK